MKEVKCYGMVDRRTWFYYWQHLWSGVYVPVPDKQKNFWRSATINSTFRFRRIDYCDGFCYNTYISIKFGFDQKQFNRVITVSFAFCRWHFFCFQPYFGHKPTVLQECRLLLYIKAVIPSKKRKEHVLCKNVRTIIMSHSVPI